MAVNFITFSDFPENCEPTVEEPHIEKANLYVERVLAKLGISVSLFPSLKNNPHLKELAKTYATYIALLEYYTASRKENEYDSKVKHYRDLLKELENSLTLEILGISENGHVSAFSSFPIMRG